MLSMQKVVPFKRWSADWKRRRVNPEMPNQIADGLKNMDINPNGRSSTMSPHQPSHQWQQSASNDGPHLSPFPKLVNPPPNVPPSDDELEATLENARKIVLNSNDPEMQLAWAADALVYVGVCADNEERIAAAKPHAARSATPRVEHQLKEDAMNVVTFLADQHHPKAEFLRGMWLEWGRFGQREDKKEAFRCYSRAADRQYARAEYRIGMLYESYNDPVKALRHYHRGVDAGDAASCYRLGMMTLRGQHGQQQDFKRGVELIKKSAEGADENAAQGAYVYGMLLSRQLPQIEVPDGYLDFDERKARMNIEKAAYLKFAKAQLKMGSAYELASLGCDFNPALSVHYNALASKQGEAEADMSLSKWFLVGSEGLFPKNEELAFTYAERAAQSGLATAEFALGYFHEIGMYVPVNLDKALEWYQKASKHGNTDATGRIEGLAKKQVLSRKDHEQVAISRIKSQHGSMRGARPERFHQQQQQRPSRLGQSTTIDEVAQSYSNGNASGGQAPPPRGASITPYPENDGPPKVPPDVRSQSVAPYPLEDGPPKTQRLGPAGGFFNVSQPPRPSTTLNPDVRPSSAFQINPELNRPNSLAQLPSYAGKPDYYGGGPPPGGPRPATTQPYDARPATTQPYDPRMRPPPANRVASGPPGSQHYPPQQGNASIAPQRPPVQHQHSSPAVPQQLPQGPAIDIGFSAPYDDRRNRQYGPSTQRPSQPPIGGKPALQSSQTMPIDKPAPLAPTKPYSKPDTKTAKPSPPVKSATAPVKPPGKGPKTFDEMGVPAQQKDGDCVSSYRDELSAVQTHTNICIGHDVIV